MKQIIEVFQNVQNQKKKKIKMSKILVIVHNNFLGMSFQRRIKNIYLFTFFSKAKFSSKIQSKIMKNIFKKLYT